MGAPPLSSVDIGPPAKVLPSKEGRRLHRSVIRIGHEIVAHAEPQRGSVLAGVAGGSSHFVTSYPSWMAVPIRVIFQEG
jgi:hypothetical protein